MSTAKEQLRLFREIQPISQDLADKKKYLSLQFQYKNEDDFDHIQNTSPTQNLVIDESTMLNQQKKRCSLCLQVQKKLLTIEYELECLKKKNARYLKIINTRRDKQKELQSAYYQIAKEFKKKIQALSKQQTQQVKQGHKFYQEIKKPIKDKQLFLVSKNIDLQFLLRKSCNFKIINFQIIKQIIVNPYNQDQAEVQKFLLNKQQSAQQSLLKNPNNSQANFYSINNSQLSSSLQQFAAKQQQDKISNTQIKQYKRQSSYYSISQQLSINQISNVLMKSSASNEQIDKNIEKELLKELSIEGPLRQNGPSILEYSFKEGKAPQTVNLQIEQTNKLRERTAKFMTSINFLLDSLSKILNTYGQKYKIYYSLPLSKANNPLQASNQIYFEDSLALSQNIEYISKGLLQQMQKIFKCSKRQYEKMINDKELSIYDLKNKIHQLQSQQARYQKIIQNYQIHKTMLSIKIIDLQKKLKTPNSQISSKRSQPLHKNNVSEQQRDQQTQCQLAPIELLKTNQNLQHKYKKLISVFNSIPTILNSITSNKSFHYNHKLDFQNNLEQQLQSILRDYVNHNNAAFQSNFNRNTTEPIVGNNLAITNQRDPSQDQKVIDMLSRQNQQLKDNLKNKFEQLLKCSEKITLYKIENNNLDKNIENLNKKIQQLNILLQEQKENKYTTAQQDHFIGSTVQHGEFDQYLQKKQYNNLHQDKDRELKDLQFKLQAYQAQLVKLRVQTKKNKKIIYIDK